ncbi:MAG: glycosyltransferase family 2 protein [Planctomycetaceae bacterium]|jgi:glycosyltransferase involved in cell wall biosynthesis|nr:glycosyltransferase family 2 protein [Planctomycetaceae bacterium]
MLKLSVCCVTYNRPHLLGELIESYQRQTFPLEFRELIILDDAGQYGDLRGDGWQVVSFPRRFASLGEKRNACVSLTSPNSGYIVIADDDDIYLPWWLECHARNFEQGARWSFANASYWAEDNRITGTWNYQNDTFLMHPNHAFEKTLFWEMGGYPRLAGWEDWSFFQQLLSKGFEHRNSLNENEKPFLIYRRFSNERHMTCVSTETYQKDFASVLPHAELNVGWHIDYLNQIHTFEEGNKQ